MLNWAGVTKEKRERLWSEAMNHATKLDGILVTRNKPVMNDMALFGKQPNWIDKLKRFGEVGIVKTLKKGNMVANRGLVGMFVGYADDHTQGTYRMMNLDTWKVVLSRDVNWLDISYGDYIDRRDEQDKESVGMKLEELDI